MSLSGTTHAVAALLCLTAACVMLARARSRSSRAAHVVVLACMAALTLSMGSPAVVVGAALALAATAAVVVARTRDRAGQACALDVAACSGLVLLMAVPPLMRATGHAGAPAAGATGLHAGVHAAIPGGADHQLVLAGLAVLLVAAWSFARRRAGARRDGDVAAWTMMLAMGVMVAA